MAQGWAAADCFERQVRWAGRQASRGSAGGRLIVEPSMDASMDASKVQIAEAYRICREIARKEARNFYYSFVALPEAKRDAICAVYAFMRHADDLADDESKSRDERRADLNTWLEAWHQAAQGESTEDPVFIALRDAQSRFHITTDLLDQLVQGTAMDLHSHANHDAPGSNSVHQLSFDTYETFD